MMDAGVFLGVFQGSPQGMGEEVKAGGASTIDADAFKSLILSILGGNTVKTEEPTDEEVTNHPSEENDGTAIPADILSLFQVLSEPTSEPASTTNEASSTPFTDKSAIIPVTKTAGAPEPADSNVASDTEKTSSDILGDTENDEIPNDQPGLKDRLFIGSQQSVKGASGTATDISQKKANTETGKMDTSQDSSSKFLPDSANTSTQTVTGSGTPDSQPDEDPFLETFETVADETIENKETKAPQGDGEIKGHPLSEDGGADSHEIQETSQRGNLSHTLEPETGRLTDDPETARMPGRIKVSPEKVEVRVDSDKLGRIDLSVGHRSGELTAQIGVERLQSLIEIQKNLPQLFTSLSEEGWSRGNFTFFLKDESRQGKDYNGIEKAGGTEAGQVSLQDTGTYNHEGALSIRV